MTTAAYHMLYRSFFFSEKIKLDMSCESSATQTIYMKCQGLLCAKIKTIKMSVAVLIDTLMV